NIPLWRAGVCPLPLPGAGDRGSPRLSTKLLSLLAAVHDKRIGPLIVSRLIAARRLAPWGHRMTSAGGLAFAAAMRMIHRVHRNAAVMRTLSHPARASRLAPGDVFVIRVSHLPNRR